MAITTDDEKLAVMEFGDPWEPGLPLEEGASFDQGEQQQLLWGYPGVLWAEGSVGVGIAERYFRPIFRGRRR